MTKATRKIIKIDEEKCNGCGQCREACHEGAIKIINGKAALISETYCDGLGACIGECPQDAITIEERDCEEFDPNAVKKHMEENKPKPACGCPGAMAKEIHHSPQTSLQKRHGNYLPSNLSNWPVQISLLPVNAPYLQNADLLISADCVPFAMASFHQAFLVGKILLIGCPKLDDADSYLNKISQIIKINKIKSIEVLIMEVPCCNSLLNLAIEAIKLSEEEVTLKYSKISLKGEIIETKTL